MDREQLEERLRLHELWLKGEPGGARAELYDEDLVGANLTGANLARANLSGADLSDALMRAVNLRNASLRGALMKGATLTRAFVLKADLGGVYLERARGIVSVGPIGHAGRMLYVVDYGTQDNQNDAMVFCGSLALYADAFDAYADNIDGDSWGVVYRAAISAGRLQLRAERADDY